MGCLWLCLSCTCARMSVCELGTLLIVYTVIGVFYCLNITMSLPHELDVYPLACTPWSLLAASQCRLRNVKSLWLSASVVQDFSRIKNEDNHLTPFHCTVHVFVCSQYCFLCCLHLLFLLVIANLWSRNSSDEETVSRSKTKTMGIFVNVSWSLQCRMSLP